MKHVRDVIFMRGRFVDWDLIFRLRFSNFSTPEQNMHFELCRISNLVATDIKGRFYKTLPAYS